MSRFAILSFVPLATACATQHGPVPAPASLEASTPASLLERDRALSREAGEVGAWRALAQGAAPGAVLFAPEPVPAQQWLAEQGSPGDDILWSPHRALLSCDANTAVTTGSIRWGEVDGYYTTVWRRDAAGQWRWLLSHGDAVDTPRADRGEPRIERASCDGRPPVGLVTPAEGGVSRSVPSADQSLVWSYSVAPNGRRSVTVDLWTGTQHRRVLTDTVEAAP